VLVETLIMFGIFAIIFRDDTALLIYSALGVIVYGFYLLIDTQLIVGGKTWELSEDDYIIGALILYIDIIILFLKILSLLSRK
jgi:FtsH-binding integral membrane protein